MKKVAFLLLLACSTANAQFVTGQILTAQQLNNAFSNVLALTGGTLTGPLTVPSMTVSGNLTVNGALTVAGGFPPTSLAAQAANTVLANATGSSASPTAFVMPTCTSPTRPITWTNGTGFTCFSNVALTSGTLAQFAATTSAQLAGIVSDETGSGSLVFGTSPTVSGATISGGSISSTPISGSTGSFTTLAASGAVSGAGFTNLFASPPAIGGTTANTGAFTALSASSTVSGTGFSTYLASPPAIGGTAPAAGKFTTLQSASAAHLLYTNGSGQSFTSGTAATVTTWTSGYDLNSNFNATTGVFTAPAAGYYLVTGQLLFTTGSAAAGTVFQALINKNGSSSFTGWNTLATSSQGSIAVPFSIILQLAANDTVAIQGKQTSGSSLTLTGGSSTNFLSISQIP